MKKIPVTFLFMNCMVAGFCQHVTYFVTDYGAKPGDSVCTTSIQKAINAASGVGGGTVVIPKGTFITGTIELKSNVNLHLEAGAVLEGSDKRKDYDGFKIPALIIGIKQHNISISGKGIIDGKGRELMKDIFKRLQEGTLQDPEWKLKRPGEGIRTSLLYFEDCDNVKVNNVFFKDATSWVTHYERCGNVTIDSARLESVAYWNNDGIDIVDCKNFHISNSFVNSADDGICLKSARRGDFCDSILVENCTIRSSANAFKLGTGSVGGFKNIKVRNLKIYDTYRSAIALEAVDGGFIENVDIRNVVAVNTGNAILIRLGHRNKDSVYSTIKNIYIGDIKVEVPPGKPDSGYEMEGPLLKYPPGFIPDPDKMISVSPWNYSSKDSGAVIYEHNVFPSSVSGLPGHPVENVTLENIMIIYAGGADKKVNYFPLDSFQHITEAEKDYPEFSMFGEVPAWGMYVRHVKGITLKNILLINKKDDYRTSLLINDAEKVELNKIAVKGATSVPVLFFYDAKSLQLKQLEIPGKREEAIKINQPN